jgi:hyperosmotically inducible protein
MRKTTWILLAAAIPLAACERFGMPNATATTAESHAPSPSVVQRAPATADARPAASAVTTASANDAISDSVITTRVKAAILSDPGMNGADVSVNTEHGVVSLTGRIKSHEQAAIASSYAQRQDGVMRVDNELAVNSQ